MLTEKHTQMNKMGMKPSVEVLLLGAGSHFPEDSLSILMGPSFVDS